MPKRKEVIFLALLFPFPSFLFFHFFLFHLSFFRLSSFLSSFPHSSFLSFLYPSSILSLSAFSSSPSFLLSFLFLLPAVVQSWALERLSVRCSPSWATSAKSTAVQREEDTHHPKKERKSKKWKFLERYEWSFQKRKENSFQLKYFAGITHFSFFGNFLNFFLFFVYFGGEFRRADFQIGQMRRKLNQNRKPFHWKEKKKYKMKNVFIK